MHGSAQACLAIALVLAAEAQAQFPTVKLGQAVSPVKVGRPVPLCPCETPAFRPSDAHAPPIACCAANATVFMGARSASEVGGFHLVSASDSHRFIGRPAANNAATPFPCIRPQLKQPQPVFRAQGAPPPPLPPSSTPAGLSADEAFNCGVVPSESAGSCWGNCWGRCCDMCRDFPSAFTSIFQPGINRSMFQSDHDFDSFISPVSNPFYLEDPRALTEVRPVFIWQRTPSFPGVGRSDIFYVGLQGRVALSQNISFVVSKLGWMWVEPDMGDNEDGFAEVHLGPKFTFIRNDETNTLLAAGLNFEIPAGASDVAQNTGDLSLVPYLSFGQTFFRDFTFGSFNFINTTGYSFRTDDERSEFLFSSIHLDMNIGNLNRFYPLVELNWFHYTRSGSAVVASVEGADMFNFGSNDVEGNNELNISVGGRWKPAGRETFQIGIAAGFNLLDDDETLKDFVVTTDLIWRY